MFNILGQPVPKKFLSTIIESKSISHFYLFVGPPGVGKGMMAIEFAVFLICDRDDKLCRKKICDGLHPDVKIIEEKTIKLSHIKEIQNDISLSPIEGKRKIVVIKDIEKLTQEAANALLKTLEEPPEDTVFILTSSHMYVVPETIVSRAQIVKFSLLPFDTVSLVWSEKLNKQGNPPVYDGTLHFVKTLDVREWLFKIFYLIALDDEQRRVYELFEEGNRKRNLLKDIREDIIRIWFSFLRDLYLPKNGGIINLYKREEIELLRKKFERPDTVFLLEFLFSLERGILFNINFNIWWEYLILTTYDILFGG